MTWLDAVEAYERIDPAELPGGVALVLKAARTSGGWFCWVTGGRREKPVKVAAAEGKRPAVYEDRPFPRRLVKGRHSDGRRFVVVYLEVKPASWSAESGYLLRNGGYAAASVSQIKGYIGGDEAA